MVDVNDEKDNSVLGIYGLGIEFCHNHQIQGNIKYQNNEFSAIAHNAMEMKTSEVKIYDDDQLQVNTHLPLGYKNP